MLFGIIPMAISSSPEAISAQNTTHNVSTVDVAMLKEKL